MRKRVRNAKKGQEPFWLTEQRWGGSFRTLQEILVGSGHAKTNPERMLPARSTTHSVLAVVGTSVFPSGAMSSSWSPAGRWSETRLPPDWSRQPTTGDAKAFTIGTAETVA